MTEANQKILYEHFLRLVDDPKPGLVGGEMRTPGSIDKAFIVKQAKEQIANILKAYPHFAEKKEEPKVTKSKVKK